VRVLNHRRAPGVEHGGDTDAGTEMFGIGRDPENGLARGLEQQVVDHRFILISEFGDRRREREDDVDSPPFCKCFFPGPFQIFVSVLGSDSKGSCGSLFDVGAADCVTEQDKRPGGLLCRCRWRLSALTWSAAQFVCCQAPTANCDTSWRSSLRSDLANHAAAFFFCAREGSNRVLFSSMTQAT